jgi:hypothetical protein
MVLAALLKMNYISSLEHPHKSSPWPLNGTPNPLPWDLVTLAEEDVARKVEGEKLRLAKLTHARIQKEAAERAEAAR